MWYLTERYEQDVLFFIDIHQASCLRILHSEAPIDRCGEVKITTIASSIPQDATRGLTPAYVHYVAYDVEAMLLDI